MTGVRLARVALALGSAFAFVLLGSALAQAASTELAGGNGWSLPPDASVDGWRIDWLLKVTMFFVVVLFVIMTIWIALACLRYGKGHTAEYDHGDGKKQVTFALGLSAVIFFVVDGNLFVNSTWDTHTAFWDFDRAEKHPNRVRIEINARQWAWDVRYAGPDGTFNTEDDIVTLNDVRVPVDAPVLIQITATDVLHSIYLPHMRQKIDAVPGTVNRLWFQAKQTGRFEIACAQHCGMAHYKMAGVLTVLSKEEYTAWAANASANSMQAYDPKDKAAHWGWSWNEDRPGLDKSAAAEAASKAAPSPEHGATPAAHGEHK